jgi:hypothetical protein
MACICVPLPGFAPLNSYDNLLLITEVRLFCIVLYIHTLSSISERREA